MAVSIKKFYAFHNPNFTVEQLEDVINVTDALRSEDIDAIHMLLEKYDEAYKDTVISLSAWYLDFNNIPFTFKAKYFLSDILQRFRFNTPLKNDTGITNRASNSLIDYIKNELNLIANWNGKTNLILLYRIKQILLNYNGLMFDNRLKKLPWKKFVFYLQQYVRYFAVYDENHVFLMTYISLQNLKLFIGLFWTVLVGITSKAQQSVKNILKSNIQTLNTLQTVYDKIRDLYTLNRMNKYTEMCMQQHYEDRNMFSGLRVLQVIGESLKDTPATPNLSKELKEIVVNRIGKYEVTKLINIRDQLSHNKSLPFLPVDQLYDILYRLIDKLNDYIEKFVYDQKSKMSKEIRENLDENKVELPNGISLGEAKNLIGKFDSSRNDVLPIIIVDLSELEIKESNSNMRKTMEYLSETNNVLGIELILMIRLEDLKINEKRLNNNNWWMKDKYPTLSGTQLRNHLAHGDPVVEMLRVDEFLATKDVTKLLLKDMGSDKSQFIQKVTKVLEIEQHKNMIENELQSIQQMQKTLDLIVEGDLNQVENQLQKVSPDWIHWCNERGENVLQLASRNIRDNAQILELILENKLDLLKCGEHTNMPLAIAIRMGNKHIAQFLLDGYIKVLLNINKIESEINYSDKFDNLLKMNHEQFDELIIDKICFIFYCYCISIDSVESLNFALLQTYYLGFEHIFESYDCPFLKIQQLFDAKLIPKCFNDCEQIKEVEYTEMMKLLVNTERNLLEIKHSRLKTGENALHVAIKCDNFGMTEIIYRNYPHFMLLADNKQLTPFEVAFNNDNEFQTKILQLVIEDGTNKHELFNNDFYNLINKRAYDLDYRIVNFIEHHFYSDNKLVQYSKLKLINKVIYPYAKFNEFNKDLIQIKETYSTEKQIMIEYVELIVFCIFNIRNFKAMQKYDFLKHIIKTLEDIPNPSQVLLKLYNKIDKEIKLLKHLTDKPKYWLPYLETLIETQTESPEIQLFQIKLIHQYNMHTMLSNKEYISYALEAVAKHSSFNDLDDHHYFIWVDVFITTTAMLQEKFAPQKILSYNNEENIKVQLEKLLNEWNVHDELKIKLLNMRTRNNKYLLITGNKDEIIIWSKTKTYMWYQMQHYEEIIQYLSLNKNIGWEEMKCILNEYYQISSLRLKHYLENYTFEIMCIMQSCLQVGNKAIFNKILEVGICYYLISGRYVTEEEIKYPTLKDYNINSISELIDLLLTKSVLTTDKHAMWPIIFYIINSDNVTIFSTIYNLIYGANTNTEPRETSEFSSLHIACRCGALEIVKYLICIGVDLNSFDEFHRSPLHLAVHYKYEEIVQLLIKQGATDVYLHLEGNAEYIDTGNHHKLHEIIQYGNVTELEMYLSEDPDIEFRSSMMSGNNCLHYAIQSYNVAMIKKVYSKCAHLTNTTNYNNRSPLDSAVENVNDGNQSSWILVVETLRNLIVNDSHLSIRFEILKKFLIKIVLNKVTLPREFTSLLFCKVMDTLISDSTDKTMHYWLMKSTRHAIEFYYKDDVVDDKLMSSIIRLFKHHVPNFSNKELIIINDVVKLFTFICLRNISHVDYAEDLINLSEHILLKVQNEILIAHVLSAIWIKINDFKSTHKIFTNYAVYAMKHFPNKQEIQRDALEMIYIAYVNGEEPDLHIDIIRNSLRVGKNTFVDNDTKYIILFAIYFILRPGIERKNMDAVLDRELNLCKMNHLRDEIINLK